MPLANAKLWIRALWAAAALFYCQQAIAFEWNSAAPQDEGFSAQRLGRRELILRNDDIYCGSSVSYNAGLGRYLLVHSVPTNVGRDKADKPDTRFAGGLAIYDAPEPWGPWTTVFYTASWDVGPGETGSFPTKWMSADGRTMHLVFSGDDCFSVRQAKLTTKNAAP